MKTIIQLTFIIAMSIFLGCHSSAQMKQEVVGTWKNSDGALLELKSDGSFIASSFPTTIFYWNGEFNKKIDGYGIWKLQGAGLKSELYLNFKTYSGPDGSKGFGLPIMISNEGTVNYLFLWQDEEGGKRYKFLKQ